MQRPGGVYRTERRSAEDAICPRGNHGVASGGDTESSASFCWPRADRRVREAIFVGERLYRLPRWRGMIYIYDGSEEGAGAPCPRPRVGRAVTATSHARAPQLLKRQCPGPGQTAARRSSHRARDAGSATDASPAPARPTARLVMLDGPYCTALPR